MVDYAETGAVHRTTYGNFMAKGKWDEEKLEETQKHESFQTISKLACPQKTSVFVSMDDMVILKTKPSSKAKRSTEGTD